MVSAVGLVNAQGGKAILVSNNSPNTTTVKMPTVSGTLAIEGVTGGVPTGTVVFGAYQTAPDGWLVCDGSSHPVATYPNLHASIGNTFGGDATNFNLPDLRANFIRGWDDGRGVDAGRAFGSFQDDAFEQHTHSVTDPGHSHGTQKLTAAYEIAGGSGVHIEAAQTDVAKTGITIGNSTNGGPETRPKNVALLPIIKY
ncbi:MAG: tail fiber protein [Methylocystaceae bacterium]|nr:tail fiber protein [Methylocystaceae bacterium]